MNLGGIDLQRIEMDNNSKKSLLNKICIAICFICTIGISLTSIDLYRRVSVRADVLNENISTIEEGLYIRRPAETTIDQIVVDKSHRKIRLSIPVSDERFYYDNALNGNSTHVKSLSYGYKDGNAIFDIGFDENCRVELTTASDKELLLSIEPYSEIYDRIYLIDPAYGGAETGSVCYETKESDVNLELARSLAEKLSDERIGVFLTREEDIELSDSDRMEENEQLKPDCYIKIRCNADPNTRVSSGVEYYSTDDSFSRSFSESWLSPVETDKNLPLEFADESYVEILCGYLTNKSDATKLKNQEYIDELAKSIADSLK